MIERLETEPSPVGEAEPGEETDPQADELLKRYTKMESVNVSELPPDQQSELEQAFKRSPEIHAYLTGRSPLTTLERIEGVLSDASHAAGLTDKDAETVVGTSRRLRKEIEDQCDAYGRTIDRMEASKLRRFHLDDRALAEQLTGEDRARRLAHTAVIDRLRAFNRYHRVVLHERYGINAPNELLIDDLLLRDRDMASRWALRTDYYVRAKHLIDLIEEQKRKGQAGEPVPSERAA